MNRRFFLYPLSLLLPTLILPTLCSFAAGGKNDTATFALDFNITSSDTQTTSVIDPYDAALIQDMDGKKYLTVTLVLRGAVDLVGVNCDLTFDPSKVLVVDIHEDQGDINFDGRANVADVLTLSERFEQATTEQGYSYFDRDASETSAAKIDDKDIEAIKPFLNKNNIFWTSNPNDDLTKIRESVEIFEAPEESNKDGKIDDIVSVLLSREHPFPQGFGFVGDARIAQITFEVIGSGEVVFGFEDGKAIDTATLITRDGIVNGSEPSGNAVIITLP
ncbi:MAG: hypothetical protein RBU29_02635 [bacterium]|nr:hypothetical protein [bacterium]